MAKKKKKKTKNSSESKKKDALEYVALPKIELNADAKKSIVAILIFVLGVISFLGLFSESGLAGNYLAQLLALGFGWGKWIFPLLLMAGAVMLYRGKKANIKAINYIGLFFFFLSYQTFFHYFLTENTWQTTAKEGVGGGYLGLYLSQGINGIFGFWGGLVLIIAIFFISLILTFNTNLGALLKPGSFIFKLLIGIKNFFVRLFDFRKAEEAEVYRRDDDHVYEQESLPLLGQKENESQSLEEENEKIFFDTKEIGENSNENIKEAKKKEGKTKPANWKTRKVKIDLPLNLLNDNFSKATSGNLEKNSYIIQKTLENFGIAVEMGETKVGPTVTQYTFKPVEGVKLSRITSLGNDLSLALAAYPIRIEAPIPGKSLVGIEVPNKTKAIVTLKEILQGQDFKERKSNLMMALGKDVSGHTFSYDISKMPHLLVAGATNSGKSVCLNSIIISLLYQNNPEDLRFIMVDPKRVELPIYNDIPHLLTPVITDVNKTINALKWCLNEMDRRFELLSSKKKKNIESYNNSLPQDSEEKIPYIVFVIDELADLMVAAAKDIEASVIRLAQMSRAVGIHLILATQRPSVDVITGLIKANIPARIAFSVASAVDSKTILDISGAEKLLGRGDMLLTSAEVSEPKRLQGAFLSEEEIKRIANYIKEKSGKADYLEGVTERQKVKGMGGIGLDGTSGDEDDLFAEAKDLIINSGKASTSLLQRRLRIGYSRAASILDQLEENGIVGPPNGSKPREILISKQQYENLNEQGVSGVSVHEKSESQVPESYLGEDDEEEVIPPMFKKSPEAEEEEKEEENNNEEEKEEEDKTDQSKEDNKTTNNNEDLEEDEGIYFSK